MLKNGFKENILKMLRCNTCCEVHVLYARKNLLSRSVLQGGRMDCSIVNEMFCEPINKNLKQDGYDPYADEIKKHKH